MFQGHVGRYGTADIQPGELMSCHMEDDQQGSACLTLLG